MLFRSVEQTHEPSRDVAEPDEGEMQLHDGCRVYVKEHAMNRLATLILASAAVVSMTAAPAAAQATLNSPSVTTEGRASIKVAPDMAWLSVTAESRAAKPADAQSANAQAMDKIRAALRAAGVADAAVKTRSYNVEPQMQYTNGKSTVIGYIAQQSLDVRVDTLANLGKVIDAAGTAATSIGDIRYDTSKQIGRAHV